MPAGPWVGARLPWPARLHWRSDTSARARGDATFFESRAEAAEVARG